MKKRRIVFLGIALMIVLLNLIAWNSSAFCDWYIKWIFPVWVNTYGRLTGLFCFSVGEWLIVFGLLVLFLAALLFIPAILAGLVGLKKDWKACRVIKKISKVYYSFFAWTLLAVCLIMTLNCFILYHASTFSEHYFGADNGEYSSEDLFRVYNMVALECNRLAEVMVREEDGTIMFGGVDGTSYQASEEERLAAMAEMARDCMKSLGQSFPQLDGWYPRPKAMYFSDFMCQQHMQGYYFPFSMEANYNDVMYIMNIPSTMCHELAHLRGYIYEDEANLIGYLACLESEDDLFRYAGYLSVLPYLYNDMYKLWKSNPEEYERAAQVVQPIAVTKQVWTDNVYVTDEEWDRINGKAIIDTETVDQAADVFIDTNLKVNGVTDGKISYSRVVRLLLQYYGQDAE